MIKDAQRYDKEDLQAALQVLRNGGIIVYPTDTVWGVGCDATNAEAVKRIYALKQREDSKSMLVLLDSPAKLPYYVGEVPETAWQLLEASDYSENSDESEYSDQKPLTLIYPHARNLAPNLLAEDGSIGIRITNEPFSKALCAQLRHPIVSTSANISASIGTFTFLRWGKAFMKHTISSMENSMVAKPARPMPGRLM